ncbi:hypothetical protein ACFQE5_06855 [Pseudonocardia hispaniensis]|uniref:Immunity protein 8 of polymorphic toxin system n=1 Tax=Pseudonocardia hispaniensis TaxID=904933 RepID=A0ABW1IZI1_9PSEU
MGDAVYFRITADSAELVDPQDLTSFSAVCPADLGPDELAASVRRADLGELLPGDGHLMVPVDTIRRMAAERVGPSWPDELAKMIDYAARKGWTNDDGTRVRAHIERR